MPVNIRGKEYHTVAERIQKFREACSRWSVLTELVYRDDEVVVMKASIADEEGRILSTGYAEEVRASSNINRTSAVENAESSACGRALAFLGYAGTEIASADEVAGAISAQAAQDLIEYLNLVRECWDTITEVKGYLANDEIENARASFKELDVETQKKLWRAPTKGSAFSTEERAKLKGTN
jgi:deoxycytidylate deaminase